MIKTFGYIGLALAAVIVVLLAAAAFRPDQFRVQRSERIAASPERLFPYLNDLHQFNRWNPYLRKEPQARQRYGDTTAGVGGFYAWEGDKIGTGSMQIQRTEPNREVRLQLDFLKPFEAHNTGEFTLQPQGGETLVTWAMEGQSNYFGKLMGMVFNMDRMIGADFEDGLKNLKQLAEAPAA